MKKLLVFLLILFPFTLVAQSFHIDSVNYTIDSTGTIGIGKTSPYALSQAVPVDTYSNFESETLFLEYIEIYKQSLKNTRAFDDIEITYNTAESLQDIVQVTLNVYVKDTSHLLALPHVIGYNSNEGWNPKLKAKDSNFLGSLHTMSADLFALVPIASDNNAFSFGAEIDFKLPFKLSIFDAEWINDYKIEYSFENTTPEWEAKTGLNISLPFEKYKYQFEFYQYSNRNLDYTFLDDQTYFTEEADFSIPFIIYNSNTIGKLTYTPKLSFVYNWDINGINILNNDLYSPYLVLKNSLLLKNVDWFRNYRKGYEFTLENDYFYYFQRYDLIPYIKLEMYYYNFFNTLEGNWFNKIGITTRSEFFDYIKTSQSMYFYSNKIGSKLRGIRDNQIALKTSEALYLNIDFPFHIWTTNFNSKLLKLFNCEVQISPFIDLALLNNPVTHTIFSLKDGYYAGGFEVLVYPKKWSSFTVRGSLGYDLSRSLLKNLVNINDRENVKKYEVSIGLGLQY